MLIIGGYDDSYGKDARSFGDCTPGRNSGAPTFRALVDRLSATNLVVYLRREIFEDAYLGGRLAFVGAAGGRRYAVIAISRRYVGFDVQTILGHELRHAVEVGEADDVVDAMSLAALYRRIG